MKNKKSLKNLKQFQNRFRFLFYVVFRPAAQKVFFIPLLVWIGWIAVTDWYDGRGKWVFINETNAGVEAYSEVSESSQPSSPVTSGVEQSTNDPISSLAETNTKGSAGSPVAPQVEVIKKVAEKEGIDWKILYAICKKESNCNPERVGDSGKSVGAFQIHTGYHPTIDRELAKDLEWSAEWTAKRLKRYAHLGESEMIRAHNGLVPNNANAYYVKDIYKIIQSL